MRKFLLPLSPIYGTIMQLRNWLYDKGFLKAYQADVPIISVGNISTGGTGKTPLAEYLLEICRDRGIRAAYLSRGYGRKSRGYIRVDPQMGDMQMFGDEALQVARKFPTMVVAVCEDRRWGIQRLQKDCQPSIIILDDAFQHRKVKRDLDIVVIDASRLPTHDHLLPAGNLREFLKGLKRADILIVNKMRDKNQIKDIETALKSYHKPIAFCQPSPQGIYRFSGELLCASQTFGGRPAIVFSGIGNNAFFQTQLQRLGINILEAKAFRDHYIYRKKDLDELVKIYQKYKTEGLLLITTEKDFCRLKNKISDAICAQLPFTYMPIQLHWLSGEQQLKSLINPLFQPSTL